MSTPVAPDRWDLSTLFSGVETPEFVAASTRFGASTEALAAAIDALESTPDARMLESALVALNATLLIVEDLYAYLSCRVAADTNDDEALREMSKVEDAYSRVQFLQTRFYAATALVPEADLGRTEVLESHAHAIHVARTLATRLMSPPEEELASRMSLSGSRAFEKLYDQVSSKLLVTVELPDGPKTVTMSEVRGMAYDADRAVRRAAHEAELAAWKANDVQFAAAMNAIKFETQLLATRRGWDSPLESACFRAAIDLPTLRCMMDASRAAFPVFRRYLRAKAKLIGVERLAFYDLFAPVPVRTRDWSWEEAQAFVEENFAQFGPRMEGLAVRSRTDQWIDVYPRIGKLDGAFCAGFGRGTSRVLMNYRPSFKWVSTLAHELGHAYHNLCLEARSPLQRETPMTLAETASIFCETIVKRAVMESGSDEEKLEVLEGSLTGACQVVVDITSRFLFEQGALEARSKSEQSAEDFCRLMRDAQLETYGDGLDPESLHPYMWAAKPHYYSPEPFYNFPYMFGLLFALGLYGVYRQEGPAFVARYDDFLSSTGMADAASLSARFGIDIRASAFWEGALGVIAEDVEAFERIVESRGA